MNTRYKILIPVLATLVVFSFFFLRSADDALLVCQDRLLNSDQCHTYLNEKYMQIPAASHFLKISDYEGFGMTVENFQVKTLSASSIEDKLIASMDIDIKADTIVYKCVALEDDSNVFVQIEDPTVRDIENNLCSSFDTLNLKGREELLCEQIGGNYNNPEYEGCVLPGIVYNDNTDGFTIVDEGSTGRELCKELGGKIKESLSCRESFRNEQDSEKPLPCDFRGPPGCEFSD